VSELDDIRDQILADRGSGAIIETSHYRASGPSRSIVHLIANSWGMKARTSVEEIDGNYYLWYKILPETRLADV
jgi:hypothetical protein